METDDVIICFLSLPPAIMGLLLTEITTGEEEVEEAVEEARGWVWGVVGDAVAAGAGERDEAEAEARRD
jgi:hypothetical protein